MNKSIIKLFLLGGLTITSITSCTDNYMDYNKNPYEVTDDEMERMPTNWGQHSWVCKV